MADFDRQRYETEVFFSESDSRLGHSSFASWLYPCTGPRVFPGQRSTEWHMTAAFVAGDRGPKIHGTIGLPEVMLTSGKWFYEVQIVEKGALSVGWARRGFERDLSSVPSGWRCGEDGFSYAYDGSRYCHDEALRPTHNPAPPCSVGDTIGCMLDLENRDIRWSINGKFDGGAFRTISLAGAYQPVLTMVEGVVDVNFGERKFQFPPEGYQPVGVDERERLIAKSEELKDAMQIIARKMVEAEAKLKANLQRLHDLAIRIENLDPSGALHVLKILDKLDAAARVASEAAAPGHQGASGSSTSGWRHASVEDYGRAMRSALEELAESDRHETERCRLEHEEGTAEFNFLTGRRDALFEDWRAYEKSMEDIGLKFVHERTSR